MREERRREAEAKVEKLKMEEQRLLAVVNKWENVDRSKAADALKQLDKVWPQLEAAEALVVAKQRGPKLRLAQPPACGIRPLVLQAADVAHALCSAPILRGVEMEVRCWLLIAMDCRMHWAPPRSYAASRWRCAVGC